MLVLAGDSEGRGLRQSGVIRKERIKKCEDVRFKSPWPFRKREERIRARKRQSWEAII